MHDWKQWLKGDPIGWLLEEENPSVRYFTLTDILGRPPDDPEVVKARCDLMSGGPVPLILSRQEAEGFWGIARDFYIRSKYKGTVWNLILLAQLGADGNDARIRRGGEFILNNSQDRESGGFAYELAGDGAGGDHNRILPCLTGNMVYSLIKFGYLEDERLRRAINWIVTYQRFDDGIKEAPKGWPYAKFPKCYGTHTCHMGAVKALKALAEIPPANRSPDVKIAIARGAEYLLKHHIFRRSHDLTQIAMPEWREFGFPLMWNDDALEVLEILLKLGYHDERMQEAVDLVVSKQDDQGRWKLETTFNGRTLARIEQLDKPSKWVTLKALKVMKKCCSLSNFRPV